MVWKSFPARLVVKSAKGFAICVCLIDFVYFDMNTLNPESLSPQRVVSLSKVPVEVEASIAKEFMKPNSIALNEFQLMSWAPLSSIAKALIQDGFDVDFQALSSVAASVSSSDKSEFLEFVIQFLLSKLGSKEVKWYTAVSEIPHETGHTILLFPCCAEALISADIKLRKKEAKAEKKSKDELSHSSTEQSSKPKSKAPPLHRKLAPIFLKNSGLPTRPPFPKVLSLWIPSCQPSSIMHQKTPLILLKLKKRTPSILSRIFISYRRSLPCRSGNQCPQPVRNL